MRPLLLPIRQLLDLRYTRIIMLHIYG